MIYIIFLFIVLVGIFFILFFSKQKKISVSQVQKFRNMLRQIQKEKSYEQQILNADSLYHKILLAYGYKGTFGEILKQHPKVINNIQVIWNLHKIRNKLAHDLAKISDNVLQEASESYFSEIQKILNK